MKARCQVKLHEINTLDLARQFIIFAAINIFCESIEVFTPGTNMSVGEFASFAEKSGVFTHLLAQRFESMFFGENLEFYATRSGRPKLTQVNMIVDDIDITRDANLRDDVFSALYAVIFLNDESFRQKLYQNCLRYGDPFTMKDIQAIELDTFMRKELCLPFGSL